MTRTLHYCDTEPYLPNLEMLPLELGGVLMKINTIGQTWGSGTTICWREILAWKITLNALVEIELVLQGKYETGRMNTYCYQPPILLLGPERM